MNKWVLRISNILLFIFIFFFLFSKSILLGIAGLLVFIGYMIYKKRDRLYGGFANAAHMKGDINKTLEWLEKSYQINPHNPKIVTSYGYTLLKYGQIERAETVLQQLLKAKLSNTERSSVQMNMALIRWKQGELAEAISILENLQSRIKTTLLYENLGYMYIEQGNLETALAYNLEAYDYNDSDAVIIDNLILTLSSVAKF